MHISWHTWNTPVASPSVRVPDHLSWGQSNGQDRVLLIPWRPCAGAGRWPAPKEAHRNNPHSALSISGWPEHRHSPDPEKGWSWRGREKPSFRGEASLMLTQLEERIRRGAKAEGEEFAWEGGMQTLGKLRCHGPRTPFYCHSP